MDDEKLEQVLRIVDPAKREFLKKLVIGAAFAVPIVASYPVKDLALAQPGSGPTTSSIEVTTATGTTTVTTASMMTTVTMTTNTVTMTTNTVTMTTNTVTMTTNTV